MEGSLAYEPVGYGFFLIGHWLTRVTLTLAEGLTDWKEVRKFHFRYLQRHLCPSLERLTFRLEGSSWNSVRFGLFFEDLSSAVVALEEEWGDSFRIQMLGEIEERDMVVAMVDVNYPMRLARHIPIFERGPGYRWNHQSYERRVETVREANEKMGTEAMKMRPSAGWSNQDLLRLGRITVEQLQADAEEGEIWS